VRSFIALAGLLALVRIGAPRQPRLTAGTVLTTSTRIAAGTYAFASADLQHPALTIRGSNITIDFSGAALQGSKPDSDPDTFTGLAVLVDGGESVTIKSLTARGYKVGILARHTTALRVTGSDLSYNWKARLYSLIEHESLLDWLSYHDNEHDEWLGGGAGIYLADSDGAQIDRNTVIQGQNGLMLARSSHARIWNNDFSFDSGIGIGLYRSSDNTIQHNRVDFDVRGYSDGFYNRGQDSAGILVYEQSSRNVVAFNSVTHGGDGFFLWAGQSTMDTGQGGANDNIVFDNDFSFAPANGIEATFSRNIFYGNRVEDCWHGLWGGYSFDSTIEANRFARNTEAIAIEHGQGNRIAGNRFDGDETAVHLWWSPGEDPTWGYGKTRDTRSRDYVITGNTFDGNKTALEIRDTLDVSARDNTFEKVAALAAITGDTTTIGIGDEAAIPVRVGAPAAFVHPKPFPDAVNPMTPDAERKGKNAIIVDDWGPYDWRSPKLWPDGRSDAVPLKLKVLGPPGEWTVASVRGATIEPTSGRLPGSIVVTPARSRTTDFDVELTYRGAEVVGPRGDRVPAGAPYTFGYSRSFVPIDWRIAYFTYDTASDPAKNPSALDRVLAGTPVKSDRRDALDYESGGPIAPGLPADRVALTAEGDVDLPSGQYTVRTISDDGVRVWVDGRVAIDHWNQHESALDTTPLAAGRHHLRVQYFELTGFAELRLEILRGR
jgi:parallel beta-helix repeat protein